MAAAAACGWLLLVLQVESNDGFLLAAFVDAGCAAAWGHGCTEAMLEEEWCVKRVHACVCDCVLLCSCLAVPVPACRYRAPILLPEAMIEEEWWGVPVLVRHCAHR